MNWPFNKGYVHEIPQSCPSIFRRHLKIFFSSSGSFRRSDDATTNTRYFGKAANQEGKMAAEETGARRSGSSCLSSMKLRLDYFKQAALKIDRSHCIPTGDHQEDGGLQHPPPSTTPPNTTDATVCFQNRNTDFVSLETQK